MFVEARKIILLYIQKKVPFIETEKYKEKVSIT